MSLRYHSTLCILGFILLICSLLSPKNSFTQIIPSDLPGLQLWLKSDTGLTLTETDKVIQWNDQSGNGNHAVQASNTLRPILFEDVLNGFPALRMDGLNDFLSFPEITNIRSVFWVMKQDDDASDNYRSLLGHTDSYNFIAGENHKIWFDGLTSEEILNGTTRLNFSDINGIETEVPLGFFLASLSTTGDVEASQICKDRNFFDRVWDGDIVEIIIYSEALDPEETQEIENYLADKYTPEYSVSEDVLIEYGFCDTLLCASEGMSSYLWSTDENTSCISVNSSGEYSILAMDDFGRVYQDTVNVQYPGNLSPENATICLGDTYTWDLGIDSELYTIEWQDGSFDSQFSTEIETDLYVTITDGDECIFTSPTIHISVDDFSEVFTLGEDVEICSGSPVSAIDNGYEITSYLWSNDSTTSAINPSQTGEYWLEAIDTNFCFASDSILVTVVGENPIPQITFDNQCFGETTHFTGSTENGIEIESWNWDFGDEQSSEDQNPNHEFLGPGVYSLYLTLISTEGCQGQFSEQVEIFPLPELSFSTSQLCEESAIEFTDDSFVEPGTISTVLWEVNGLNLSGLSITSYFSTSGTYPINHTAISSNGCLKTENTMIEILPIPDLDIDYEGVCLGEFTDFSAELLNPEDGAIDTWSWDFGDQTTSGLTNPSHLFTSPGIQNVTLYNQSVNGCIGTSSINVYIRNPPEASMANDFACLDQIYILDNTSLSNGGSFTTVEWSIDGIGNFSGDDAEVTFPEVSSYLVTLDVETNLGCTGSTQTSIFCAENPEASMSFNPLIGLPPLDVDFQSTSNNDNDIYSWLINDEELNGGLVNYTFTDSGIYTIELVTTNFYGCSVSTFGEVNVDQPLPDLMVSFVDYEELDDGLILSARITNNSNFLVRTMDLSWTIDNGISVLETWEGELDPGEMIVYTFESNAGVQLQNVSFVCVQADGADTAFEDITPQNNKLCQEIGASSELQLFSVFPNPVIDNLKLDFLLPANGEYSLRVIDNIGRVVNDFESILGQQGYNQIQINLSNLRQGNYLLVLKFDKQEQVIGFVKE